MHKVAFDIITDLEERYNAILTCIDVYSRYPWAIPITNRKMKTVVNALWAIFTKFGFPKLLSLTKNRPMFQN